MGHLSTSGVLALAEGEGAHQAAIADDLATVELTEA